jgi:hypothetical protein
MSSEVIWHEQYGGMDETRGNMDAKCGYMMQLV